MRSGKLFNLFIAFIIALGGVFTTSPSAFVEAGATNIRISQVYGGGGLSNAVYKNDYVELFNPTNSVVSLSGLSIQYGSASGTTWGNRLNLSGSIQPFSYYLVQLNSGGTNGADLPTPDITSTIDMSGTNGKVALVNSTTALSGACPLGGTVLDFVGYGSANCKEGTATVPALSVTTAALRNSAGCVDEDDNSTDFTVGTPAPRNSSTAPNSCASNPTVTSTVPTDGASGVSTTANLVVNFSEPVNAAPGAFSLSCNSSARSFSIAETNPSATFTLDPADPFNADYVCTVTVTAASITDTDTPGSAMAEDYVFSFSIPIVDSPPAVVSVVPSNGANGVSPAVSLTVNFNENVTTAPGWFTLECPVGTNIPTDLSGTGSTRAIDPTTNLPGNTTCRATVHAAQVSDLDGTIDTMAADYSWQFATSACGGGATTSISAIQGSTSASPLVGQSVTIEGIVTGDYQASNRLGGFFVQSAVPDADPLTSEAIFVYNTSFPTGAGDYVRLTGTVQEYFGGGTNDYGHMNHQTQLASVLDPVVCATGQSVAPTVVNLPVPESEDPVTYLERYEGMLITIPQTLTVQQNFFQGRFGQLTLGSGGRIVNHINENTGLTFASNLRRMIILDDGSTTQNPAPIPYYAADGALRAGDTVAGLTGVLDQGEINSNPTPTDAFPDVYYRLHPTVAPVFTTVGRPAAPPQIGGQIKVASYNVLNYFTTFGSRGANNATEFIRQHQKLVNAICALDADVVGLIEIENNGTTAVNTLLNGYSTYDGLNDVTDCGPYAVIADPPLGYGPDEIKTTFIYRTTTVQTVGGSISANADPFDEYRYPVAQTFRELSSSETFSVVVNHFKSKRCSDNPTGGDADLGMDGGCFNATRVAMANTLLGWINSTLVPVDPDVLVIGDLNAYGGEDPIETLTSGGLIDQVAVHLTSTERYSYVFDGTVGYLDHALSTASLGNYITGVNYWHINADEPAVIDYNTEYKDATEPYSLSPDLYQANPYRSSDHDPVLIGLAFTTPPTATDDSTTTPEETPVEIDVLSNDADNNGGALTIQNVTDPAHGTAVITSGKVTYTPDLNWSGVDTFNYTILGSLGSTDSATVTVTVNPVNDDPTVAIPLDNQEFLANFAFTFTLPAGAFTDVDSASLTLTSKVSPDEPLPAWLAFNSTTGEFTGSAPLSAVGTITIRVTASDGSGGKVFDEFDLIITQPRLIFLPVIVR